MLRSPLIRDVGVTWSGQVIGSGIGFCIGLLAQRQLGPADYGLLGLASSAGSLSSVLTDLGLSHAMVRFGSRDLAQHPERAAAQFAATFWCRMALTLLVSIVGCALAPWLAVELFGKPQLSRPLQLVYACAGAGALYNYWQFYVQTIQRFALRSLVQASLSVVKLGLFLSLMFSSSVTPLAMILLDAGISLAAFCVGMRFASPGLLKVPFSRVRKVTGELGRFARFSGLLLLGDMVFNEMDTLMLGMLSTDHVLGVYRCAWNYAMVLGFLNMSVSNVLFPKVSAVSDRVALRAFMGRIIRVGAFIGALTLPIVPLLYWWIPYYESAYAGAAGIFGLMYIGLVFELVVGPLQFVLYSLNRPGLLVANAGFKIALHFVGNLLLIPIWGAYGAATVTILTRVVGGVLVVYMIHRLLADRDVMAAGKPTLSSPRSEAVAAKK